MLPRAWGDGINHDRSIDRVSLMCRLSRSDWSITGGWFYYWHAHPSRASTTVNIKGRNLCRHMSATLAARSHEGCGALQWREVNVVQENRVELDAGHDWRTCSSAQFIRHRTGRAGHNLTLGLPLAYDMGIRQRATRMCIPQKTVLYANYPSCIPKSDFLLPSLAQYNAAAAHAPHARGRERPKHEMHIWLGRSKASLVRPSDSTHLGKC
jgi:hypothetical protein